MRTWIRIFVVMIALMNLAEQKASAQTVYEPFDYPSSQLILGQNGGTGWAGPWTFASGPWVAGSPGLTFGSLTTQGNTAQFPEAGGGAENRRSFASPFLDSGGDLWFSFLTRPDNGNFANFYNGLTILAGAGSTEGRSLFVGKNSTNAPYGMSTFPSIGFVPTDVSPIVGNTVFLVGRIQFAAGNDTITLWANPTPGLASPDTTAFVKTDYDFGASVDGAYIYGGGSDWSTDELRFGDSYGSVSVSAVPEPASWALIGGASVVGGWILRRRRIKCGC